MKLKSHKTFLFFSVLLVFTTWNDIFAADFYVNLEVKSAYQKVFELKLDQAEVLTRNLKRLQPENLSADFLEDYIDFFKIFIADDSKLFKKLAYREGDRLKKIEKTADDLSPYKKYLSAEINLHWALINLKFGNYFSAFNRIKRAFNLLQANTKLFPAFTPNQKSLGLIHALISTIPNEYRWLVKALSGLNGNMNQARFELEQVILYSKKNDFLFKDESLIIYSLLLSNFDNDPAGAWHMIKNSNLSPSGSPLVSFLYAYLATKNYQNDLALQYLEQMPVGNEYYPVHYFDFFTGICKLRRLDPDASDYLQKFIKNNHGTHLIKECYQKLAWSELVKGNKNGYLQYISLAKTEGASVMDEDKQAEREATLNRIPDVSLLKARLLFDGGYFQKAEQIIMSNANTKHTHLDYELEANYRLGRIYHLEKKYDLAISSYLEAAEEGIDSPEYYACAAFLYAGQIYDKLNLPTLATYYFEKCLKVNPKDYSAGLHQKAKIGINKLNQ